MNVKEYMTKKKNKRRIVSEVELKMETSYESFEFEFNEILVKNRSDEILQLIK